MGRISCRLNKGLYLEEGDYKLVMQEYCDLVRYNGTDRIWDSHSQYAGKNCHCDLAVYNEYGAHTLHTNTSGVEGEYVLLLRPDGEGVVYRATWYMGTKHVLNNLPSAIVEKETS
ncbi:hypothetical protein AMTRI_Chr08g203010 [Amborella trichopoda]